MCGKSSSRPFTVMVWSGSPPRVREKLYVRGERVNFHRITPACAGKAVRNYPNFLNDRDHPRVCGKSHGCLVGLLRKLGSPPRVREKLPTYRNYPRYSGITPACAGKAGRSLSKFRWNQDHPRVCGKSGIQISEHLEDTGSPPRVREKLRDCCRVV